MKADLDRLMAEAEIDALWITGSAAHNVALRYFVGAAHLTEADLIKKQGDPPLLIHREMEARAAAGTGLRTVAINSQALERWLRAAEGDSTRAKALQIRDHLEEERVSGRIAVHGRVDASEILGVVGHLRKLLPGSAFLGDAGPRSVIRQARRTKDEDEISRIRRLGQTTVEVVRRTADWLRSCQPGDGGILNAEGNEVTVGAVKRRIHQLLAERDAASPLGPIFAPGREGAELHSTGRDSQPLLPGVPIVFDLYPQEIGGGYHYDFTRTWCLGRAPDRVRKLHRDVQEVLGEILDQVRSGASPMELQQETCRLFEARGHASIRQDTEPSAGYLHALGHGLGLELHEAPVFRHYPHDANLPLEAGMVLTVEPGLYYPEEEVAVRLEDTVLIHSDGRPETLVPYPYDLLLPLERG